MNQAAEINEADWWMGLACCGLLVGYGRRPSSAAELHYNQFSQIDFRYICFAPLIKQHRCAKRGQPVKLFNKSHSIFNEEKRELIVDELSHKLITNNPEIKKIYLFMEGAALQSSISSSSLQRRKELLNEIDWCFAE